MEWFAGWPPILRTVIVGVVCYVVVVALVRIAGKRTLANMDEFDLVVTIAIGSLIGNAMLARDVALPEIVVGIALLVGLQVAATWIMSRTPRALHWMENEPQLLIFQGKILRESMRAARLTEDELLQAVRRHGVGAVEDVAALVMEPNGDFSVIRKGERSLSALRSVKRPPAKRPPAS
jgi:uncharacterized membrane protein YcaP (DUF421 family)